MSNEYPNIESNCEVIWIETKTKSKGIIIGTFYRSPDDWRCIQIEELTKSVTALKEKLNSNAVIILGDFNLPNVNWENHTIMNQGPKIAGDKLLNMVDEFGFKQCGQRTHQVYKYIWILFLQITRTGC